VDIEGIGRLLRFCINISLKNCLKLRSKIFEPLFSTDVRRGSIMTNPSTITPPIKRSDASSIVWLCFSFRFCGRLFASHHRLSFTNLAWLDISIENTQNRSFLNPEPSPGICAIFGSHEQAPVTPRHKSVNLHMLILAL
jgi:hypothetical protein